MRNIFDQYTQPENRLTHSLVTALYQDLNLLKDFLREFGFQKHPPLTTLEVIEQGLPGKVVKDEYDAERQTMGEKRSNSPNSLFGPSCGKECLGHPNISRTRLYDRRKSWPEDSPTFRVRY